MPNFHIVIADRQLTTVVRDLRECLTEREGEHFGRWMASAATGRFVIITPGAQTLAEWLWNLPDETALIAEVSRRIVEFLQWTRRLPGSSDITVETEATPDVQAKMRQLVAEFQQLTKGLHDELSRRVDLAQGRQAQLDAHATTVATAAHVVDYQPPQPSSDREWGARTRRWQLKRRGAEGG